jgi:bifunctional non-homologous end joining protein LigD
VQEQADTERPTTCRRNARRERPSRLPQPSPLKKARRRFQQQSAPATKQAAAAKSKSATTPAEVAGVRKSPTPTASSINSTGVPARSISCSTTNRLRTGCCRICSDRPVSLVRAPEDIGGELFFQKHSQKLAIPNVTQHPGLDPGHPPLITIDTYQSADRRRADGHDRIAYMERAWPSNIEKPDRMVFDLDPDPALGWDKMIEAAQLTRTLLDELGLVLVLQDERRQRLPRGRAARQTCRLGRSEGVFAGGRTAYGGDAAQDISPRRWGAQNRKPQDLRRLPAQQPRLEHGGRLFSARTARPRRIGAACVGRSRHARQGGDQWTIANLHERLEDAAARPVGRLREDASAHYRSNEEAPRWREARLSRRTDCGGAVEVNWNRSTP